MKPKTYKLALRSPKNDRQVWVLKGVPDEDYGDRSSGASLGVDPRTETALWLVDNGEGTAKAEIAAVHRELYDLHQIRDIFNDGDRIVMPKSRVRRWHSYDPNEQSFVVPEVIFYADGFHILRQMPESRAPKRKNPRFTGGGFTAEKTCSMCRGKGQIEKGGYRHHEESYFVPCPKCNAQGSLLGKKSHGKSSYAVVKKGEAAKRRHRESAWMREPNWEDFRKNPKRRINPKTDGWGPSSDGLFYNVTFIKPQSWQANGTGPWVVASIRGVPGSSFAVRLTRRDWDALEADVGRRVGNDYNEAHKLMYEGVLHHPYATDRRGYDPNMGIIEGITERTA